MLNRVSCCGVREYNGLQMYSNKEIVQEVADDMFKMCNDYKFVILTDNNDYGWNDSKGLLRYIQKHKLGTVTKTDKAMNPNSGNFIQVFVWKVDITKLKKWYDNK